MMNLLERSHCLRVTAVVLALSLLVPSAASASSTSQGSLTDAQEVEQIVKDASTAETVPAHNLTISPHEVSNEDDGIVTIVANDASHYASITIDDEVSAGISLADSLPIEEGAVTAEGTTVFSVKDSDDAFVFQILEGGSLSASAVAASPDSSRTFVYELSEGISPVVQDTGAVALYEDGVLVGIVEHPEALDALGREVPSSYTVTDGDLVQNVAPGSDTAYPMVATARVGVFLTRGDYVHVTGGQASGHGWWVKGSTDAMKAKVTVQLQYKPSRNSSWNNRGKAGVRTIKPGTSKRANARMTCRSTGSKQWRSWVDVDLIGYLDTPDKFYTNARSLRCTL